MSPEAKGVVQIFCNRNGSVSLYTAHILLSHQELAWPLQLSSRHWNFCGEAFSVYEIMGMTNSQAV